MAKIVDPDLSTVGPGNQLYHISRVRNSLQEWPDMLYGP